MELSSAREGTKVREKTSGDVGMNGDEGSPVPLLPCISTYPHIAILVVAAPRSSISSIFMVDPEVAETLGESPTRSVYLPFLRHGRRCHGGAGAASTKPTTEARRKSSAIVAKSVPAR
jgi:hypothetical protein